ncbi:MAG TPA: cupin domain-containing protein [Streptosporangiaceae bacterium]
MTEPLTDQTSARASALGRCVSVPAEVFARKYWAGQPLHSAAGSLPRGFGDLFSPAAADELLTDRALRTPFIRMAREGSVLAAECFTASGGFGAQVADQVDPAMVLREFAAGATIVLQGLHRTWPALQVFTRELVAELGHPAQVNAYITPESARGFDPHYDVHDVFVLQVSGEKHWRVHAPVRTHPRADEPWSQYRAAVTARAREEPELDVVLRPGDALYLPRGWLHSAVARAGTSIHLTVGVASYTGADVVRELMAAVAGAEELRAPLPIMGSAAFQPEAGDEVTAAVRHLTAAFLTALRSSPAAAPDRIASALGRNLRSQTRPEPVPPLATIEAAASLSGQQTVRLRHGLSTQVTVDAAGVHLKLPGLGLRLPLACEAAIRALAGREAHRAGALPGLDEADSLVVSRRLLRSGILVTGDLA